MPNSQSEWLNPLSRNDAIAQGYLCHLELLLPTDGELLQQITAECRPDEDLADAVKRLLTERLQDS